MCSSASPQLGASGSCPAGRPAESRMPRSSMASAWSRSPPRSGGVQNRLVDATNIIRGLSGATSLRCASSGRSSFMNPAARAGARMWKYARLPSPAARPICASTSAGSIRSACRNSSIADCEIQIHRVRRRAVVQGVECVAPVRETAPVVRRRSERCVAGVSAASPRPPSAGGTGRRGSPRPAPMSPVGPGMPDPVGCCPVVSSLGR